MKKIVPGILLALIAMTVVCLVAFIAAIIIMPLWNWLMPTLFGLGKITYMQAWGIYFLSDMLFKNSSSTQSK